MPPPPAALALATSRGASQPLDDRRADAVAFVLALGEALHAAGAPAHRLEAAMADVCRRLDLEGHFFSTPTLIMASFDGPELHRTSLVRVEPRETDLGSLDALSSLADDVAGGTLDVREGRRRLRALRDAPPARRPWLLPIAFGVLSATAAVFLGGGPPDVLVGGLLGVLVGALALLLGPRPRSRYLFELVAPACVAFGAATWSALAAASTDGTWLGVASPSVYVTSLAALIALVPGFTLTVAVHEVATRNLASGTARATAAGATLLQMAVGLALGERLAALTFGAAPTVEPAALAWWAESAALVVSPPFVAVLFRSPRDTVLWVTLLTIAGFLATRGGGALLERELGAALGAFVVGVGSNLFSRRTGRPAALLVVPAILMLVPGSFGFRSVSSFLTSDIATTVDAAVTMMVLAMALSGGLLVAHAVCPTRKAL